MNNRLQRHIQHISTEYLKIRSHFQITRRAECHGLKYGPTNFGISHGVATLLTVDLVHFRQVQSPHSAPQFEAKWIQDTLMLHKTRAALLADLRALLRGGPEHAVLWYIRCPFCAFCPRTGLVHVLTLIFPFASDASKYL